MRLHQQDIQELATDFRLALEELGRETWKTVLWNEGPNRLDGICDPAHQILAKIIEDRFGISPNIVHGEKYCAGQYSSHVWLEIDGLIVDVTGDKKTVVITTDRSHCAAWDVDDGDIHQVDSSCEYWFTYCEQPYRDISRHLENLDGEN